MPVDLKQKFGPLPLYAWGGIGLAGILIYYAYENHAQAGASPVAPDAGVASSDTAPDVGGLSNTGGGNPGINDGTPTSTDGPSSTNAEWETEGVAYLTSIGTAPIAAQRALELYLLGTGLLTWGQGQLVDKVIKKYGLPPEGTMSLPGTKAKPKPAPKPSSKPKPKPKPRPKPKPKPKPRLPVLKPKHPVHHDPAPVHRPTPKPTPKPRSTNPSYKLYTVQRGDTLWALSRRFYGASTRANEEKIAKANGIHNLNLIYAGHTIKIPR